MKKNALGERLKILRLSKRMTLAIMAERVGVTVSSISAYENGTRTPSYDVLLKLATLFNVTVDNLIGNTDKDMVDISGLSVTQKETVRNMIMTYKKFNCMLDMVFDVNIKDGIEGAGFEYYVSGSMEVFMKEAKERRQEKR